MTSALLTALLVVLVGTRCRLRPPRRVPGTDPDAPHARRRHRRSGPSTRRRTLGHVGDDPGAIAEWCDQLSRAVRSGSTLTAAIRVADPPARCRRDLDALVLALDRGVPLHVAAEFAPEAPHVDVALTVVRACALHGGSPGEPLDRAASTLRARSVDLAERRTHSAQARMSAVVMTVLPLAMLVALVVASAPVRAASVSGVGLVVVAIGGAFNVAGWRWMRRLIDGRRR